MPEQYDLDILAQCEKYLPKAHWSFINEVINLSNNEKYQELIMAVERKYPDESRHEVALRYIRAMEEPSDVIAGEGND